MDDNVRVDGDVLSTWAPYDASKPEGIRPNEAIGGSGDFDGDGWIDYVRRDAFRGYVTIEMGNPNLAPPNNGATFELKDPNWLIAGVGDFTRDGKPDILWRNQFTGQNVVWVMNGTKLGRTVELERVDDARWQIGAVADFDGDGDADIAWRHSSAGVNIIWNMDGLVHVANPNTIGSLPDVKDPSWRIEAAADLNGDGHQDLVWRNYVSGDNVLWRLQNGTYRSWDYLVMPDKISRATVPANQGWKLGGRALGASVAGCGRLLPGEALMPNDTVKSCSGDTTLVHQDDGNVVVYRNGGALWHTHTSQTASYALMMQTDGNLVLYSTAKTPLWNSATSGNPASFLAMQDDGNAVIYRGQSLGGQGAAIWYSGFGACPAAGCRLP